MDEFGRATASSVSLDAPALEDEFHGMYGCSSAMHALFEDVRLLAQANGPVLIQGESGVGKELVASAIHKESRREQGPFLAVNCASIPEELLESELFGHTPGAFTGAGQGRKGMFAEADGGTLLLDEVAEMSPTLQAKLLRVLEESKLRPIGNNRERAVDVRVLAATNRDLAAEVRNGRFRADLFYRLEAFTVFVPPLRERGPDRKLLASMFFKRFCVEVGREIQGFSPSAWNSLAHYEFPGNVRELRNTIERAVTFCRGPVITAEHLPERIRRADSPQALSPSAPWDFPPALASCEELPSLNVVADNYIRHVLDQVNGNKRRAAEILGIGRHTLYRRLKGGDNAP